MEKSIFVQTCDLSPEKRHAAEVLLGGALDEDELLLVRASKGRILKPGLNREALNEAYRERYAWSAEMAKRVEGVPQSESDAAIDETVDFVRHSRADSLLAPSKASLRKGLDAGSVTKRGAP